MRRRALDVACGTGDLTLELAARVGERGEVVGCDFSASMLELARRKAPGIQFDQANALRLPYPDDAFDAATVGFGARNFSDLRQGLAEMARVVRPGGRVVVLEITNPQRPPLSWFYRVWFDRLVPMLGRVTGRPTPTATCPTRCAASPLPRSSRVRSHPWASGGSVGS